MRKDTHPFRCFYQCVSFRKILLLADPCAAGWRLNMSNLNKSLINLFIIFSIAWNSIPIMANENIEKSMLEIKAGNSYSAVLKSDGTVWMWGYNNRGQLGNGTTTDSDTPAAVTGLSNVEHIAAGKEHMVALKTDGTVWAWGYNNYGQLGNDTTTNATTPVQVKTATGNNLSDIVEISAGESHSLALKADGTVWAWGCNTNGRLGDGTQTHSHTAIQVTGLSGITDIAAGGRHNLAIKNDGTVWAWGYNNYGQLGIGSTTDSHTATSVSFISDATMIAAGANHSLVLDNSGQVFGFGRNDFGQLGTGDFTSKVKEVIKVADGTSFIAAGENVSFIILNDETVKATGYNYYGQLGLNNIEYSTKVQNYTISTMQNISCLAIGRKHVIAQTHDDFLFGWGDNSYSSLDAEFDEKKGMPRILRINLNDKVGNELANAVELNSDQDFQEATIDYIGDIDIFTIKAPETSTLFLTVKSEKEVDVGEYNNNNFNIIFSGQNVVTYEKELSKNQTYYLSVSGSVPCNFIIEYHFLKDNEILDSALFETSQNLTFTGNTVLGNRSVLINVYNPDNELSDVICEESSDDGTFTINYDKDKCNQSGNYQFVISSYGTRNNVVLNYNNTGSSENANHVRTTALESTISVGQPDFTFSELGNVNTKLTTNLYFNIPVTNMGTESQRVKVTILQLNQNNQLKDKISSAMSIRPNGTALYKLGKDIDKILATDNFHVIITDEESNILVSNILNIDLEQEVNIISSDNITLSLQNIQSDEVINTMVEGLEEKQNVESGITIQSIPTTSSISSVMNAKIDGEYYEGLFKMGELELESKIYNPTDEEIPAYFTIVSYKMINGIETIVDLQTVESTIFPFFNDTLVFSRSIDEEYFNSCDDFRLYTGDDTDIANQNTYGEPFKFSKILGENNWGQGYLNSPEVLSETVIHGIINNADSDDYVGNNRYFYRSGNR